jgi:uncharacterized coiled-coil protein SlyX
MDKLLILTILGLQTTLMIIGINTLKDKLNDLEGRIKVVIMQMDGQANKVIAEIEEKAQFEEKALGTLAQNIAACAYEVKEVKDQLETNTGEIKADIKKSTHTIVTTPTCVKF